MPRPFVLMTVAALAIIALSVVDLIHEGVFDTVTVALEFADSAVMVSAMGAVAWVVHGLRDLRDVQSALANNLARAMARGESWRAARQVEINALGQAIEVQFQTWNLTPAEIDIAGLMLKGASLKEIALARDTSEATIRQQAQSIYRKSGLSGRTELSAYFLESLFHTAEDQRTRGPGLTVVGTGR